MLRYLKFCPPEGGQVGSGDRKLTLDSLVSAFCVASIECPGSGSSFCHCDESEGPWNLSFLRFMINMPLFMSLLLDGVPVRTLIINSEKGVVSAHYGPVPVCCTCCPCLIQLIPCVNSSNPHDNSQKVDMTIILILETKKVSYREVM